MAGPQVKWELVGDVSKTNSAIDQAITKSATLTDKLKGVGKGMVIGAGIASFNLLTGAIEGGVKAVFDTIDAASDLNETVSKVGIVFGDSAAEILKWGESSATAFGMSTNEALTAAGTYGNLFVSMGLTREAASGMSMELVELAGDLASFNNASPVDTLAAIQSGLVGETEPLRAFGINLSDAALRAEAMSLGIYDGVGALSAAEKAQASYSLILKQSTTAQGDFERTSDGLANQQRITDAKMANLSATIGQKLLPIMLAAQTFVVDTLIPAFEDIVAAISPIVSSILTKLQPAFEVIGKVVKALQPVFEVVFKAIGILVDNTANTIGIAFDAIAKAIEFIEDAFRGMGNVVRTVWNGVTSTIRGAINTVIRAINGLITGINGFQIHINLDTPVGAINFDWGGLNLGHIAYLHQGGIVPGRLGQDVPAILQAGERVIPAGEPDRTQVININIGTFIGSGSDIDRLADLIAQRQRLAGV